tara:strand:- start:1705 stop:1914 length:210 start_codon:yes stop_codon:yes gene_type:complete
MALKKQTLRRLENIQLNGNPTTKEELILLSESWSKNEEIAVRKIIQQGGQCKIGNDIISVNNEDIKKHY